jgi:site-specific recombinase XerD
MTSLFENFLKERRYLKNITANTVKYYRQAWKRYEETISSKISKANAINFVIGLREKVISPISCNTYISKLNAFFRWPYESNHVPEHIKFPKLVE